MTMRPGARIGLPSAGLLAAAVLAAAPQPDGPGIQERVSVSLVSVPVTVRDRDGRPLTGLTASDFDLRDEGRPVTLEAMDVDEYPLAGVPAAGQANVSPAARRRFLLLFDLSFSTPSESARIRQAAREFVAKRLGPEDLAAAATYSLEHGFKLLVSFTSDRQQLAAAIESLGIVEDSERSPDPLQLTAFLHAGALAPSPGAPGPTPGGPTNPDIEALLRAQSRLYGEMATRQDAAYRRGKVAQLLQSFGALARALDSVEGRKQILYFSQGFDMRLLSGNAADSSLPSAAEPDSSAAPNASELAVHGQYWEVDSQARFGSSGLQLTLNSVLELFRRSDCVIHAVDLAGLRNAAEDRSAGGEDALLAMAEGTGGELFQNANDFGEQLDRVLRADRVVYVLSFRPDLTGHPGKFHSLRVRVDRPGARVSAREGYYEPKPFASTGAAERRLSAADAIATMRPERQIPMTVDAIPFAGGERAQVPVVIRIPGGAIGGGHRAGSDPIPFEIYGYAFEEKTGSIGDFFSDHVHIDPEAARQRLDAGGFVFYSSVALPPGSYALRILVRNGETGAAGLSVTPLVVPNFRSERPVVLPALFVETAPRGLVARGNPSTRSVKESGQERFPFVVGDTAFLPKHAPELVPGRRARLCVYAYGFDSGQQAVDVRIGGRILDAQGADVAAAQLSLLGVSRADAGGRSAFLLAIDPEGLAAGQYRLLLELEDPVTGVRRGTTAAFQIGSRSAH
jgi:VWFA-related protein